jgi:methylmalonyl-CoA epimerase
VKATGVHHVALAVRDLDEALAVYTRLFGAEVELREEVEPQGVDAAYLRVGESRIELLAPLLDDSPVGRFLDRRGPGMHHVAFAVPDVASAIRELEGLGATMIDSEPRRGLGGHEVAFVDPDSVDGVLVEVLSDD